MNELYKNKNKKLIFYTGNKGKFAEIKTELSKNISNITLIMNDIDIPEIQSTSNKEVIKHKLRWILDNKITYEDRLNVSFIVEDTGLYINSKEMNGFPGALIKYYMDHLKPYGICKQNGGSPADAVTYIGLWDSNTQQELYFNGCIKGTIAEQPSGSNGFGYDPCFVPFYLNEYKYFTNNTHEDIIIRERNINDYTFADLNNEQKTETNMRTICVFKLCKYINDSISI